jgi:25S rRNA (adenine2142-N1)-methyltransferase
MPKSRKRKQPITSTSHDSSQQHGKPVSGHHLIRKFHVLLKRRELLVAGSTSSSHELEDVENEIGILGGLEAYQRISARGQSEERGGGSEKVFVGWLRELGEREMAKDKERLR